MPSSSDYELESLADVDLNPDFGLTVTPELLELQIRLEASIEQQRKDEAMARRLQQLEEASSPSQTQETR